MVEHSIVVMSARLNPMGSRFSIPKSGRKILRPSWGLWHLWFEFNYRDYGILTCFSILIFWTLCVEKRWGGDRKHCFVNFCCLVVLEFSLDERCRLGQKLLFRASWNRIFFQPGFQPKKQAWQMLYQLDISTFYFYEPLLFQIFSLGNLWKLRLSLVFYHFYSQQPRR